MKSNAVCFVKINWFNYNAARLHYNNSQHDVHSAMNGENNEKNGRIEEICQLCLISEGLNKSLTCISEISYYRTSDMW
jgi:hypothetical protein